MLSRAALCKRYLDHAEQFTEHAMFRSLEAGRSDAAGYDAFLRRVSLTHLHRPRVVAFLRSVAAADIVDRLRLDLLEPIQIDRNGFDRPSPLEAMLIVSRIGRELPTLRSQAQEEFDAALADPRPYATKMDLGFAMLIEAVAFEFMLDRIGRRICEFLQRHRGLPKYALCWFNRASNSSRAAHGLNDILAFAECYRTRPAAVSEIVDTALGENIFVKRYFGWRALPTEV
jgi:hypothetical protein